MKTIKSLRNEAEIKMQMWADITNDKQALSDRNKTEKEALMLVNYFEGKVDAFNESLNTFK